ncbi:uncharacterized protein LOC132930328 [Rhopalosiphum padi]|uniref:uncharacterized protein LOC132930328 n=1 Tax=Rhopalosiphum padi TaxID=40932 RepID=UPI00298DD009|nr:uncharacterized protein LOC132930328 [Rhopalosiphum padi]
MILYLLFFYFLGLSSATDTSNTSDITSTGGSNSSISTQVMCYFKGNLDLSDSTLVNLDPAKFPKECDVIIYSRFSVNMYSEVDCDDELLKSVTDLKKPVILTIKRDKGNTDWSKILNTDGNADETKMLCDFASSHNVAGYLVTTIAPESPWVGFDERIGKNIIPYIKQLKKCGLIIGVSIYTSPSSMKNPCVYNFDELNDIVDFYEILTWELNSCDPNYYNGRVPISLSDHGSHYYYGMEEVVSYLKESKICLTKLTFIIEMYPTFKDATTFNSYAQVCSGQFDNSTWCVQTSLDFYHKGKFVKDQKSGIIVALIDLDDVNNDCGCTAEFNGFKNIIAGFTSGSTSPCKHFDVQTLEYPLQ